MDLDSAGFAAVGLEDRGLAKDVSVALPWQTVVPFLEPSGLPLEGVSDAAPDTHLSLEWAYGFNAKASRQTVRAKKMLSYRSHPKPPEPRCTSS